MNLFRSSAAHHFAGALRVFDVHPEQRFHHEMKAATAEPSQPRLRLMQHRARQPARANDAIRFVQTLDQRMKCFRRRCAIRIHIADDFRLGREFESLDERPALADGIGKIEQADG